MHCNVQFIQPTLASILKYSFFDTRWGKVLVTSTDHGLRSLAFVEDKQTSVQVLRDTHNPAIIHEDSCGYHINAKLAIDNPTTFSGTLMIDVIATPFQTAVWEYLLTVPIGSVTTYGGIAHALRKPRASRAVGGAVGANPIAFIIPCHRVVQKNGKLGNYMWGVERKAQLLAWEFDAV